MNWKTVSVNVVGTSNASLNNKSAVEEITMCIILIILL